MFRSRFINGTKFLYSMYGLNTHSTALAIEMVLLQVVVIVVAVLAAAAAAVVAVVVVVVVVVSR